MEFRQLKTFIMVAKLSSFTKAADELGYAQSTITSQIQSLEDELSTKLFDRLGKQIKVTKDGEQLYLYAEKILSLAEEAKDLISSTLKPKGALTIGTAESLCTHRLPAMFKCFRTLYPNIELSIRFDTCIDYRTHLRKNAVDAMIFLDAPLTEHDFVSHILFNEPMAVIAAPSHSLARLVSIRPRDLNNQALVLTDFGCSYRRIFESILTQEGVKPSSILGVSSNEVIKKFVCDGWGIGFLPLVTVRQELSTGQLVVLPWAGPPFNIKAQLIYHKDKWISPALKVFIELTLNTFANKN